MKVTSEIAAMPAIQQERQPSTDVSQNRKEAVKHDKPTKKDVKETVDKFNDFIDPVTTNLRFVFHEDLHEYYVTVVDPLTDEVVREIPPKKLLDMYHAMSEYIGLLVDKKI